MKARLIISDGVMQILLCTGDIKTVDERGAFMFLSTYSSPSHYEGPGRWNDRIVRMEDYTGQTIAIVDDAGGLHVEHAEQFATILKKGAPRFLSIHEFSTLHRRNEIYMRRLCREGRIMGAIQKGQQWFIPDDAPVPSDARKKTQD